MKNKLLVIIVSALVAIILVLGLFENLETEPNAEIDRHPDCELVIFSGDDGVCLRKNQIADLDWSSIESCSKTGKIIQCDANVYPKFTECDEGFKAIDGVCKELDENPVNNESVWEEELRNFGCGEKIISHLSKHTNLLDEEFDGKWYIEEIGLPSDVSYEKFDECMAFLIEIRTAELE